MRKIIGFCFVLIFGLTVFACNNSTTSNTTKTTTQGISTTTQPFTTQTPTTALTTSTTPSSSTTSQSSTTMPIISENQALVVYNLLGGEMNVNGNIVTTQYGKLLIKGELALNYLPTKEGHTFDGWYLSVNEGVTLTDPWTFSQPVNEHLNLYAKWLINRYSITLVIPPNNYNPLRDSLIMPDEVFINLNLGTNHMGIISSLDQVYTWGNNLYGQLGTDDKDTRYQPTNITSNFDLDENDRITYLAFGEHHSGALSENNQVFFWGYNDFGQLGTGYINNYITPMNITDSFSLIDDELVMQIALGNRNSGAVTSKGRVFVWGSNSNGQIADGGTWDVATPYDLTPRFNLEEGEKIVQLAIGFSHMIALTSGARVFTWGNNFSGQLGDGTNSSKNVPIDITSNFNLDLGDYVKSVYAGEFHSAVLTNNSELFTFGFNGYGQLGDNTTTDRNLPVNISDGFNFDSNDELIMVSLGTYHSSALTALGEVFTWGDNSYGQLGNGNPAQNHAIPISVTSYFDLEEDESIIYVKINGDSSGVISSLGKVYVWGNNQNGQLGNGKMINSLVPTSPKLDPVEISVLDFYYNEVIAFLPEPEKVDDVFHDWFTDPQLNDHFSDLYMPAKNLILYARFESFPYYAYNVSGYLNPGEEIRFYFILDRPGKITAYVISDLDTFGELRDNDDNLIESDDDSGLGLNFMIEYVLESGAYYISLTGYDEDEFGEFHIIITVE